MPTGIYMVLVHVIQENPNAIKLESAQSIEIPGGKPWGKLMMIRWSGLW